MRVCFKAVTGYCDTAILDHYVNFTRRHVSRVLYTVLPMASITPFWFLVSDDHVGAGGRRRGQRSGHGVASVARPAAAADAALRQFKFRPWSAPGARLVTNSNRALLAYRTEHRRGANRVSRATPAESSTPTITEDWLAGILSDIHYINTFRRSDISYLNSLYVCMA